MREIDVQSLVVDAVRLHRGAAHKLSNRFLVGVSDLLVKLPRLPALLLEVKLNHVSSQRHEPDVIVDPTHQQKKFLLEYRAAGMNTGVLSAIIADKRGVRGLAFAMFDLDWLAAAYYRVPISDHVLLGNSESERYRSVVELLSRYCHEQCRAVA